ncbi:MAG: sulfatase-like hydrolase/transferase [Chloroflexi bacterium]|nr:sulfatase-like hydrolase/transferase [Chloroflexota bacterium]
MSDEHDPQVSSPYGHSFVVTPALQQLAETGCTFDAGYCNSPLCVPSRASFMTGKHLHRIGVWDNGVPLASDEPTWAHRLSAVGYDTALAGKMHFVGPDQLHGFRERPVEDVHHTLRVGNGPRWLGGVHDGGSSMRRRIEEAGPGDSFYQRYDDRVATQSIAYLADPARHERPWALCTSFITPHFPLIVRPQYFERYWPRFGDLPNIPEGHFDALHPQSERLRRHFATIGYTDEQIRRARAAYYGLVTFCDERIGMVLAALETYGLAQNTVVAYVADHGEMLGEHGMWWKCSFYEPSARIPFVIRWPERFPAGKRFGAAVSLLDLVRTMLSLAGDPAEELDGRDLSPLLQGDEPDGPGLAIAEYEGHGTVTPARMVRRGQYKLNYYIGEEPELFDLATDPRECINLVADARYAPIRNELTALALADWDGEAIHARVLESQRRRQLITAGLTATDSVPSHHGRA